MRPGFLLLLLGALVARAESPETPALRNPLPFDHSVHGDAFRKTGVNCADCHPVGLRVHSDQGYEAPAVDLHPPLTACHGCHRAELPGAPRTAPNECMLCHADREALKPISHGMDWVAVHGPDARAKGAECSACHATSTCVDCHEARGPGQENPHPPGFRSFHGVEARLESEVVLDLPLGREVHVVPRERGDAMVRLLALLLLAGCADEVCPYGSMLDNDEGLVVTEAEHPTGWGQATCTECHAIPQLHRHGCTPGVDDAGVRVIVDEEGLDSCTTCHGTNGVEEE